MCVLRHKAASKLEWDVSFGVSNIWIFDERGKRVRLGKSTERRMRVRD